MLVPIAPGKTNAWIRKHKQLMGPEYDEYAASRRRFGLTRQISFLQRTPMGDFELLYLTSADMAKSFHTMSASKDAWDVKWRQLTRDFHGKGIGQGKIAFPKIEIAFRMDTGDLSGTQPFMFAVPVSRGHGAELRRFADALMGGRNAEYQRARARIGVKRETVFLQSSPAGQLLVFYWLAADPQGSLRKLMASSDPSDKWLRAKASELHPMALDLLVRTVMANTLAVDYPRR